MADPRQQSRKPAPAQPTGTSGRQRGSDATERSDSTPLEPATPSRRPRNDEDEDSPLGNRNTYR
jgi:hypothetical protein